MDKKISPQFTRGIYGDPAADTIMILCAPFHVPQAAMALPGMPAWHFMRAGYRVVVYSYPLAIGTSDAPTSFGIADAVVSDANALIATLPRTATVYCYGTSMGSAIAFSIAARNPRVTKVALNLCYYDIAEHIIHTPRTWLISPATVQRFITSAGGPTKLQALFAPYSPHTQVAHMEGKHILLYQAERDRILRYAHTRDLPAQLLQQGAHVVVYTTRHLGHFWSAFYNHLYARRYLDFFADTPPAKR